MYGALINNDRKNEILSFGMYDFKLFKVGRFDI